MRSNGNPFLSLFLLSSQILISHTLLKKIQKEILTLSTSDNNNANTSGKAPFPIAARQPAERNGHSGTFIFMIRLTGAGSTTSSISSSFLSSTSLCNDHVQFISVTLCILLVFQKSYRAHTYSSSFRFP